MEFYILFGIYIMLEDWKMGLWVGLWVNVYSVD